MQASKHYPFSAVIGQSQLKTALMLIAIDPKIGGILISGIRGSAKSTLARGLADLLDQQTAPFVNLPLGVSEDRLLGSLNLEKVLADGSVEFIEGLFAQAHDGVLYVDEVNLLASHLVDLLLDVSASGVNYVERDGVSHQHLAEFLLVGTMNPDEGELRPQLLDRFGLCVNLQDSPDAETRMQIVQHRLAFDDNPTAFQERFACQQHDLRAQINIAQKNLAQLIVPTAMQQMIAERCQAANVEGVRADLALYRAARAYAVLNNERQLRREHIDAVEDFVLQHRRQEQAQQALLPPPSQQQAQTETQKNTQGDWGKMPVETIPIGLKRKLDPNPKKKLISDKTRERTSSSGKLKTENIVGSQQGQNPHYSAKRSVQWHNTLLHPDNRQGITKLIYQPNKQSQAVLHIVLLDTSGSMLGKQGLSHAKGTLLYFCESLYQQRDQLCVISFGNQQVEIIFPPKAAPKSPESFLEKIKGGGGTPLSEALQKVWELSQRYKKQVQALYILTDGRVQEHLVIPEFTIPITLIDMESETISLGRVKSLAERLKACYVHSNDLIVLTP